MINNISYVLSIDPLEDDKRYATINNNLTNIEDNLPDQYGKYFSWGEMELHNTIISPEKAISKITFFTSSYYNLHKTSQIEKQVNDFVNSLIGRTITVTAFYEVIDFNSTANSSVKNKIIYKGYISSCPENVDKDTGSNYILECKLLIGTLNILSANGSWVESLQTYNSTFTTISSNQLALSALKKFILNGVLAQSNLILKDGGASALPNKLWAFLTPNRTRYQTIIELLVPYSRIFYQNDAGDIIVQPLFVDDYADDNFNVNISNNIRKNYLKFNAINNSMDQPNRVDVTYGFLSPVPLFDNKAISNQVFSSAPYIQNDKIVDGNNPLYVLNNLSYTQIYKTITRLYNMGYVAPQMRSLELNDSIRINPALLNPIFDMYSKNRLKTSITNKSSDPNLNSLAQLYAQIFLAEINADAYNAVIKYDLCKIIDKDSPLAKLITIDNSGVLDYNTNLVVETIVTINKRAGSNMEIKTAPLLSITGSWFSKDKE